MLDTAKSSGDPDLLITRTRGCQLLLLLDGCTARLVAHGDKVLALYDGEKHRHLADLMNHDPRRR
jgi:hypothetical protein